MLKINEQDEVNKGMKLLAKSTLVVFIGLFLSKILSYVYRIVIAREFGPDIYGVFSLAIMVVGWFMVFSSLGLKEGLLRYIPLFRGKKEKEKIKFVFRFVFKISLVSGIFFGAVLFFLSDFISIKIFHNSSLAIFLKFFSLAIPFSVLANPLISSLRAYEKISWHTFISNILYNAVRVFFLILLLFFGLGIKSIFFSYVSGFFMLFLASYVVCKHKIKELFFKSRLKQRVKRAISKELIFYSIPLIFFSLMLTLFSWVDLFLIGYFKSSFEVGLYNAAVPIAMLLGIIPGLFVQLFFPLITKEYSRGKLDLIKELSKQVGKWTFMLNLPILILIVLFPEFIINILFGNEYLVSSNALVILSLGMFFSSILVVSNQLLYMIGKSKIILVDIILALTLNFSLNYFLIPMEKIFFIDNALGINGASIATTISLIFFNLLFLFQAKHYLSIIPARKKMLSILMASIMPGFILFYLKDFIGFNIISAIVIFTFFILLYCVFVIFFKGLDRNDIFIINSIKKFMKRN